VNSQAFDLYRQSKPSQWADPPAIYSFSSLSEIERCPLQWQLRHSIYGPLDRYPQKPNSSAVEGEIVHKVLEQLIQRLALVGFPALGTSEFADCLGAFSLRSVVAGHINDYQKIIEKHPRRHLVVLKRSIQELSNQVVRLLRAAYVEIAARSEDFCKLSQNYPRRSGDGEDSVPALQSWGVYTEIRLTHPNLPFAGVLDLVLNDDCGPVIVDYKTGKPQPSHKEQLLYYALLWWRCSQRLPIRLEVRYRDHTDPSTVSEDCLETLENQLAGKLEQARLNLLAHPSSANLGEHCRYCDARAFCNSYWNSDLATQVSENCSRADSGFIDIQMEVTAEPSEYGLTGRLMDGSELSVVFAQSMGMLFMPFYKGEILRILGASPRNEKTMMVEFSQWTEVFHCIGP
jgi:hypothetical protein